MSDDSPEALLRSALEKIVYFEARSEQLQNDLAQVRGEAELMKRELGSAAQREIQLRREIAQLEVEVNRSHREREEQGRLNEALRTERAALIEKLIEASRIHSSDQTAAEAESHFDLASFISELRSEAVAHKRVEARCAPAVVAVASRAAPAAGSAVRDHAIRLSSEGRLRVSDADLHELAGNARLPGRTEETLFGFSVRELSAPSPAARVRAAERLKAMSNPAAAPALAAALHAETDATVLVALLQAFSEVASREGAQVVSPFLEAHVPEVRIAALKGLIHVDPSQAGPHLSAAMKDPDRSVRRRASLLALGLSGAAALQLGEEAIGDADPEVRSLAALVLGAGGGDQARVRLLGALRDPELKVRRAASESLSRILGQDVSAVVTLDDAQRRREVRKLSAVPANPVTGSPFVPPPEEAPAGGGRAGKTEELCAQLVGEVRAAIRGRSLAELASALGEEAGAVAEAVDLLVARKKVVCRGKKYFAA